MKKTIITLSALFVITSLTVSAQDDGKKKTDSKTENNKTSTDVQKAPGGGTRMAISTKGAPATKNATGNSNTTGKKSTTGSSTLQPSPNTNADGTPKSN